MQIEDSSLIGIIELESPAPFDFDTFLNPDNKSADKTTNRRFRSPASRWSKTCHRPRKDAAASRDAPSDDSSVIALRFPRPDRPTSEAVEADLTRLEEELRSELQRLRFQLDRLRPREV